MLSGMELLLTALGGAAVTAAAGVLGAWVQGRREHKRWVRERRYEAYVRFLAGAERFGYAFRMNDQSLVEGTTGSLQEAIAEFSMLGPDTIYDAAKNYHAQLGRYIQSARNGPQAMQQAMDAVTTSKAVLIELARKELKIKK